MPAGVSVVVIAYNDAGLVGQAVASALDQGPEVTEVVAVDDASTDGTGALLDELAAREPRLVVLRRTENSGGCGTPRNDGLRAARGRYVMFLDSDDVLPPGAVRTLLDAAARHQAPVAAGRCVRRELPGGAETPWQRELFLQETVHRDPQRNPRLVRDTLCVNKLYARDFLLGHGITFPEGAYHYEDFVFSARVLAAADRLVAVPDTVYVWNVRRASAEPSISLDRDGVRNWHSRLRAHADAVRVLEEADHKLLAHAARTKFLDHDLRMYVRELPGRSDDYQRQWWQATREHLARFDEADLRAARAPGRWLARVVTASQMPRDLTRMAELAARPARLLPPYATRRGRPVWSQELPEVRLDGVESKPIYRLPLTVEAEMSSRSRLRVRVHDLYGRLAGAGVSCVDVELRHRTDGRLGQTRNARPDRDGGGWAAGLTLDLQSLADRSAPAGGPLDTWDVYARIRCANGRSLYTAVRPAGGASMRRTAVASRRHGLLLVQPYATHRGSLALRVAPGLRGAWHVVAGKARRLVPARLRRLTARAH
ncbi:glycosyltransferase family 2 protein [Streptomyces sp. 549]|uniref:glycosyltransferase family 2 protein n=1 Tax=Streptomyces sp. 549 TaxID=3049076 RepID=UPI0024C3727D|nr:glycosyltransferase family 2 protein [Streptomyces sp. 549]MDK1473875.1 glycosyltransferase family 2 protein [Streptomyces sp. 549]